MVMMYQWICLLDLLVPLFCCDSGVGGWVDICLIVSYHTIPFGAWEWGVWNGLHVWVHKENGNLGNWTKRQKSGGHIYLSIFFSFV